MRSKEHLQEARDELRTIVSQVPEVMEGNPRHWYRGITRKILTLEQTLPILPPETQEFMGPVIKKTKETLREEARGSSALSSVDEETRGVRAEILIKSLSRDMAERFEAEVDPVTENVISLDQLITQHEGEIKRGTQERNGEIQQTLSVRHPLTAAWHTFPLPPSESMWYKGGVARLMLDIHAQAGPERLAAELPWNDRDVVFVGDEAQALAQAQTVGVGLDGVEKLGEEFDFNAYCFGRDTTQNQVCLGRNALHYSEKAYHAAKTGEIEVVGEYMKNRALFGNDQFEYEHVKLVKPRGLMRLMKFVAEGKAESFQYYPINANIDLGIYWMVLARKWEKKEDFGYLMQRLFELGKRMGQTDEGEHDVYDALRRSHTQYPFFDLDRQIETSVDVARWLSRKIARQVDREFAWEYSIPGSLIYSRQEGDTIPQEISLRGFEPSDEEARRIASEWSPFAQECRYRTRRYQELGIDPLERHFYDMDTEMPMRGD